MARRGEGSTQLAAGSEPEQKPGPRTKRKARRAPEDAVVIPPAKPAQFAKPAQLPDEPEIEQLLTFRIGKDEYGISILRVREIAEYRPLTPVPMTPPWMRGVMNLRGVVVPVIDLSAKLGLQQALVSRRTCLIIVETETDGEKMVMAMMVDSVSRVVDVSRSEIQEPPPFGLGIDFVPGLVRVDDRLIVLLDLLAILSSTELVDAAAFLPALREVPAEGVHARQ
ncbi:MAG TPA: chemotaxis protein CheW [Thermoanaerobaculia bacterium]|nr:chemotaxis protein CheW [Thermoanaerobaculia bacterium]